MKRTVLVYGAAIAAAATLMQWLEYRHAVKLFPTEVYVLVVALAFTSLGLWAGNRLTRKPAPAFEKNVRALESLGISDREYEVLLLLAAGHSNREIADRLYLSPNTVKTHLLRLYEKLEASRRTQAVQRARALRLIP